MDVPENPERHGSSPRLRVQRSELEAALTWQRIEVRYQPIVDLAAQTVGGVEALVRWRHPRRGTIMPAAFIPLAESSGLIIPLGAWVLRTACRQVATWQESGHTVDLSVNVSARQLEAADFVDAVCRAIAESGLDPLSLTLEITESVLMRDPEPTSRRLAALKSLGIRIAIDDFGTGYSSLGSLCHLPVDVLKVDRSFVAGVPSSRSCLTVLHMIIELAHNLGLQVVAEGIENPAQLRHLRNEGCRLGQGFLFAPALEPTAVLSLLSAPVSAPTRRAVQQ